MRKILELVRIFISGLADIGFRRPNTRKEPIAFILCDVCLSNYQALHFDPSQHPGACIIPYATLLWHDEHPGGLPPFQCKAKCVDTIHLLVMCRTNLWFHNSIPVELVQFWENAHSKIPDWPGFRRLKLTTDARKIAEDLYENVMRDLQEMNLQYGIKFDPSGNLSRSNNWSASIPIDKHGKSDC